MKIVLIGFMGSGKSSVAKVLAKNKELKIYEVDELIVRESPYKSIVEIFKEKGNSYFRELEEKICIETSKNDNCIVSSGGGAVMNENIMNSFIRNNFKVVYLKASFDEICNRVAHLEDRPLFKDLNSAKELFSKREATYSKYGDIEIDTNGKTIEDISNLVIKSL